MSDRYERMFQRLASSEGREIAFVPFVVIGDPDAETSLAIMRALIDGGADALELGIAFSDPLADGPLIQAADQRALAAGATPTNSLALIRKLREEGRTLPIGLLVYANLVEARGVDSFYAEARDSGVDSVLIADVPDIEAEPYLKSAQRHGVKGVLIATATCDNEHLSRIASLGRGYTYVVTRVGVTGVDRDAETDLDGLLHSLHQLGAPPPVLGFGISRPEQVSYARKAGAAGAISGSAIVSLIERHLDNREHMLRELKKFVAVMKQATRSVQE